MGFIWIWEDPQLSMFFFTHMHICSHTHMPGQAL